MAVEELPQGEEKHRAVRWMFERIAPRYDLMNRLISLGLDQHWRRAALRAIDVGPGDRVVDVACGTGDLSALAAGRGARVLGLDFAHAMLVRATEGGTGLPVVRADAARMPIPDGWADAVVCGFALRNFVSIPQVVEEMARILAPGGRVALLEIGRPERSWLRAGHRFYFERIVPRLGALLSDGPAYAYLPQSVAYLPSDSELLATLEKSGFAEVQRRRLVLGMTQIFSGVRR